MPDDAWPVCADRGRLLSETRCFCRHSGMQSGLTRATPVTLDTCRVCPMLGVDVSRESPKGGPGTELTAILRSIGAPSCDLCADLARRMDEWGPDECSKRRGEIVADIMPRARKWASQLRFPVPVTGLAAGVRLCVRLAIARSRTRTPA